MTCQSLKFPFSIKAGGPFYDPFAFLPIWESFYRVDKSHNREAGRFGLGLFAVKTIIEKHNGTVGVINTKGGVLFYFEIPEYQAANAALL